MLSSRQIKALPMPHFAAVIADCQNIDPWQASPLQRMEVIQELALLVLGKTTLAAGSLDDAMELRAFLYDLERRAEAHEYMLKIEQRAGGGA